MDNRITIEPGRRHGKVEIPSSKSIAHRAIIAAALSGAEPPVVRGESRDTVATRNCLRAMMSGDSAWPCGESGTTLRLLEPIAGVMNWEGEFACEGRLGERPRMPFEKKPRYVVPGNVSSQFVSGLLMALPLASWDSEIAVEGGLQSESYVRLTEDILKLSGIDFTRKGYSWFVKGGQQYRFPGRFEVEGDWSQAAFFLAMGVEVTGLNEHSAQGDRAVVEMLAAIDAATPDGNTTLDVSQTPDLYPVLAATAAAKGRRITFSGTERLRLKESDRIASTAALIESVKRGEPVMTFGDHRIAMSAAVMACYSNNPIVVDNPGCVAKSYPGFWNDFASLSREL